MKRIKKIGRVIVYIVISPLLLIMVVVATIMYCFDEDVTWTEAWKDVIE